MQVLFLKLPVHFYIRLKYQTAMILAQKPLSASMSPSLLHLFERWFIIR